MSREAKPFRRKSALLSFRFLVTAVAGSVLMGLVAAFGPQNAQLAVLGCFISVVGGLFLAYLGQEDTREERRNATVETLGVPLVLASDPELFRLYRALCDGLTAVARQSDPLLRDAALEKFVSVADQIGGLAQGKVAFALTEGWRTLYERLLKTPGLREYRSVAWVRSADYWQDVPGRQSMRVNFEAAEDGLLIEDARGQAELRHQGTQPAFEFFEDDRDAALRFSVEGEQRLELARGERQRKRNRPVDVVQIQVKRAPARNTGRDAHCAIRKNLHARAIHAPGIGIRELAQVPQARARTLERRPQALFLLHGKPGQAEPEDGKFKGHGAGPGPATNIFLALLYVNEGS